MTAALPAEAAAKLVEIWFTDEARVGQQGTLARVWAKRGRRGISSLTVVLEELDGVTRYCSHRSPCHDDIAFLQYTSGSTLAPKGVMVSHGSLLANLEMMRVAISNHRGSTHVIWLPLYHDMGLIQAVLQSLDLVHCVF